MFSTAEPYNWSVICSVISNQSKARLNAFSEIYPSGTLELVEASKSTIIKFTIGKHTTKRGKWRKMFDLSIGGPNDRQLQLMAVWDYQLRYFAIYVQI